MSHCTALQFSPAYDATSSFGRSLETSDIIPSTFSSLVYPYPSSFRAVVTWHLCENLTYFHVEFRLRSSFARQGPPVQQTLQFLTHQLLFVWLLNSARLESPSSASSLPFISLSVLGLVYHTRNSIFALPQVFRRHTGQRFLHSVRPKCTSLHSWFLCPSCCLAFIVLA